MISEKKQQNLEALVPKHAYGDLLWSIHLLLRRVALESVRFRNNPGMHFRAREVEKILSREVEVPGMKAEVRHEVHVNTGGLAGVGGPLPFWFEELLAEEDPDEFFIAYPSSQQAEEGGNAPVGDFLDIFSHRFILLLYRAWVSQNSFTAYQRGGQDAISRILFSILGMPESEDYFSAFRPARLLGFGGLLGHRSKSAVGLECLLRAYFFGLPIGVRQFVLRWVKIPQTQKCQLGIQGCHLGQDVSIGERVADISGQFRVEIGPLSLDAIREFMPGGDKYKALAELVHLYVGHAHAWKLALRIKTISIPRLRLGHNGVGAPRLGYTSWLNCRRRPGDVSGLEMENVSGNVRCEMSRIGEEAVLLFNPA